MYYVLLATHILVALLLGVVVLVQRSKGNGLAGAFGGVGAGEAMFGARGVTTVLHKATIYLAITFMVTSLSLVVMTTQRSGGNSAGPARSAGGVVLPVGGADVAAPDAPATTPITGAGDDVVPTESAGDSIVPAAEAEDPDATADEQKEGEGSEAAQEEGGR